MPGDQTVEPGKPSSPSWCSRGAKPLHAAEPACGRLPLVQSKSAAFGPCSSVPCKDLKDLLDQVVFAMAVHDIRYYLNGILFVAEARH